METKQFKSPVAKLVTFFRTSRDGWKRKCQDARQKNKLLSNQVRAVEKSREQWKERAKSESQRAGRLERELEALKTA